jgi:predicted O-methyltransferase YrrM
MFKLSMLISFLKHRFKAKTRHGVHSPFVYRLIDEVIYDFHAKTVYLEIEPLRAELINYERQNHLLKKTSLMSPRLAQLVYRLVSDLKPGKIIEIGACLGFTSAYLAKAAPEASLFCVERYSETLTITKESLQKLNIHNVKLLSGNANKLLPELISGIPELDFILIDGNHRGASVLNYFNCCLPKMSKNSMMIFEDIYRSSEMKSAWKDIKSNPEVSVTIDLFWIGLVFVRRAQRKEDFFIRF